MRAPLQARDARAGPVAAGQVKLPQRLQLMLTQAACMQDLVRHALLSRRVPARTRAGQRNPPTWLCALSESAPALPDAWGAACAEASGLGSFDALRSAAFRGSLAAFVCLKSNLPDIMFRARVTDGLR